MDESTVTEATTGGFLDRMEAEVKELNCRIDKANNFLQTTVIDEKFTELDYDLLQAQSTAMATYSNILLMRINRERTKRGLPTLAQF